MVVITQKRFEGQDGFPTHPKLVKAFNEIKENEKDRTKALMQIPHRYYFPKEVLKNFIKVKKVVLKNQKAYLKSGGGNKMTSAVIIVDGSSGSGKSTVAGQIGLFFYPSLTLENNYAWNIEKLMKLIENASAGEVIIFDEAMILNSRSANSQDNIKLIIALSQVRSKGVFLIFCINSVHQLEKSIPLSRADFLIHIKRLGGMTGTPKYCVYDKDRMKQLIVKNSGKYSYSGVYPNISWTTFSRYFPFDDVRYDTLKHLESLKNLQINKKSIRDEKIQIAIGRLATYCKEKGFFESYQQICDITKLPKASLSGYRKLAGEKDV